MVSYIIYDIIFLVNDSFFARDSMCFLSTTPSVKPSPDQRLWPLTYGGP